MEMQFPQTTHMTSYSNFKFKSTETVLHQDQKSIVCKCISLFNVNENPRLKNGENAVIADRKRKI